jgi:hypothetical protein
VEYVPATTPPPIPDVPVPPKRPKFNIGTLRKLITNAFDEMDLREICQDYPELNPVAERLTQGMDRRQMVDLLLDYGKRHELLHRLIQIVRERNPDKLQVYVGDLWERGDR